MPPLEAPRFDVAGVGISCTDLAAAGEAFFGLAAQRRGGWFAFTCAHGLVESQGDARLRAILNGSRFTMPDGMPLVWLGRRRGASVGRVTAPDFMARMLADPRARALRHYFYGASPATLERIVRRARGALGDGPIAGWHSPPIRPAGAPEDPEVLARIADSKPDVVWVGLGLPKQEYWMANHAPLLPGTLMMGVGAAFDWYAGVQPRAPRWLQAAGLEWLHRVACEPLRLGPRYGALLLFANNWGQSPINPPVRN